MRTVFCVLLLYVGIICCSDTSLISTTETLIYGTMVYHETLAVFPYAFSANLSMIVDINVVLLGSCRKPQIEDIVGKIVIVLDDLFCSRSASIKRVYEEGGLAIGFAMTHPGRDYNYFIPGVASIENFFVFSVTKEDYARWENRTGRLVLTLSENENEFEVMYDQWWFILTKFMFIVLFSAMTVFIFWKLVQTLSFVPFFHIIPVCLIVELLSSLLRVLYWIDVMGSSGLLSYHVATLLFYMTYGPSFVVHLLISLYWLDSISISNVTMFLSPSSLIVLSVIASCFVVLIVISSIIPELSLVFYVLFLVLSLFTLVVFIFYVYAIIKLTRFVNNVNSAKTSSKSKVERASRTLLWYIISGVFCFLFIVVVPFSVFTFGFATKNLLLIQTLMVCLFVMSFSKIYPTDLKKKSSSTGKSSVVNSKTLTDRK